MTPFFSGFDLRTARLPVVFDVRLEYLSLDSRHGSGIVNRLSAGFTGPDLKAFAAPYFCFDETSTSHP